MIRLVRDNPVAINSCGNFRLLCFLKHGSGSSSLIPGFECDSDGDDGKPAFSEVFHGGGEPSWPLQRGTWKEIWNSLRMEYPHLAGAPLVPFWRVPKGGGEWG